MFIFICSFFFYKFIALFIEIAIQFWKAIIDFQITTSLIQSKMPPC